VILNAYRMASGISFMTSSMVRPFTAGLSATLSFIRILQPVLEADRRVIESFVLLGPLLGDIT